MLKPEGWEYALEVPVVAATDPNRACGPQLLEAVRALKPACTSADGFSVEALHAGLQRRGYIVELKHTGDCAARSVGRRCLENLHHTYVECRGSLAGAVTVGPAWLPPAAPACGAVRASLCGVSAACFLSGSGARAGALRRSMHG